MLGNKKIILQNTCFEPVNLLLLGSSTTKRTWSPARRKAQERLHLDKIKKVLDPFVVKGKRSWSLARRKAQEFSYLAKKNKSIKQNKHLLNRTKCYENNNGVAYKGWSSGRRFLQRQKKQLKNFILYEKQKKEIGKRSYISWSLSRVFALSNARRKKIKRGVLFCALKNRFFKAIQTDQRSCQYKTNSISVRRRTAVRRKINEKHSVFLGFNQRSKPSVFLVKKRWRELTAQELPLNILYADEKFSALVRLPQSTGDAEWLQANKLTLTALTCITIEFIIIFLKLPPDSTVLFRPQISTVREGSASAITPSNGLRNLEQMQPYGITDYKPSVENLSCLQIAVNKVTLRTKSKIQRYFKRRHLSNKRRLITPCALTSTVVRGFGVVSASTRRLMTRVEGRFMLCSALGLSPHWQITLGAVERQHTEVLAEINSIAFSVERSAAVTAHKRERVFVIDNEILDERLLRLKVIDVLWKVQRFSYALKVRVPPKVRIGGYEEPYIYIPRLIPLNTIKRKGVTAYIYKKKVKRKEMFFYYKVKRLTSQIIFLNDLIVKNCLVEYYSEQFMYEITENISLFDWILEIYPENSFSQRAVVVFYWFWDLEGSLEWEHPPAEDLPLWYLIDHFIQCAADLTFTNLQEAWKEDFSFYNFGVDLIPSSENSSWTSLWAKDAEWQFYDIYNEWKVLPVTKKKSSPWSAARRAAFERGRQIKKNALITVEGNITTF